jgi:glutamate carboxypeptidase
MLDLLKELVRIPTGSHYKAGIDAAQDIILRALSDCSLHATVVAQQEFGNHLVLTSPAARADERCILMTGHVDTVFPAEPGFQWYEESEERVFGPGVIDMKGGLVVLIFAVLALEHAGLLRRLPLKVVINSDEEIGSPSSRSLIEEAARHCAYAFVLECGGPNGEVVTGRKGKLGLRLNVAGQAGHAAFAGRDKASAILELAYKVIELESLNDPNAGLTVNVGTVAGGIGPNTVAEEAEAEIDVRYVTDAQRAALRGHLHAIIARAAVPRTSSELAVVSERPPMEQTTGNLRLFAAVREAAAELGLSINDELRSGVSDANFIAAQGTPVVDGLGPVGGRDHSRDEFMEKRSLLERAKLLTLSLLRAGELTRT